MRNNDTEAGCLVVGVGCFLMFLQIAFTLGIFAGACWIVKLIFF